MSKESYARMSELQSLLQESVHSSHFEFSRPTQAHMAVPIGTVRNLRQSFENRIAKHVYEQDRVYINRAIRNMDELICQSRTYAEQLRLTESATLFELPIDLVNFLRDHDNLCRAAVRSRQAANKAAASPDMDVFLRVAHRLLNLRNVYYVNIIEETRSPTERLRQVEDPLFINEFNECTLALQDEIVRQLTCLELLLPSPARDVQLENVGPDHTVDDYGHNVTTCESNAKSFPDEYDHTNRCCICLEAYTTQHTAFLITQCKHIIGKSCLSQWLNSTWKNANLCPHCRTSLCERRARQPVDITSMMVSEQRYITDRLQRVIFMMGDVEMLYGELFGTNVAFELLKGAIDTLNYRLFENDIGFCLEYEAAAAFRWGVRRVNWH
jgi:hypothetical protein